MKAINVLLVDDDAVIQQLAHHVLDDRGIKLWNAFDTSEADSILKRRKIDVILCDIVMTPEDGLHYCTRLRERSVRTPIILMSAQLRPAGMHEKIQNSETSYLMKPFMGQIYQRILEALVQPPVALAV